MNQRQAREVIKHLCRGTRRPLDDDTRTVYGQVLSNFDLDVGFLAVGALLRERPRVNPTPAQLAVACQTEHDKMRGQRDLLSGPMLDEYRDVGLVGVANARAVLRERVAARCGDAA